MKTHSSKFILRPYNTDMYQYVNFVDSLLDVGLTLNSNVNADCAQLSYNMIMLRSWPMSYSGTMDYLPPIRLVYIMRSEHMEEAC